MVNIVKKYQEKKAERLEKRIEKDIKKLIRIIKAGIPIQQLNYMRLLPSFLNLITVLRRKNTNNKKIKNIKKIKKRAIKKARKKSNKKARKK